MTDLLDRAIALAIEAHAGQVDKVGQPYILHPLRVMVAVSARARIVAVLHDVVEDTWVDPPALLLEGFARRDIDAIERLSRRRRESYPEFIVRIAPDPIAREVKIADIRDNLAEVRLSRMSTTDARRLKAKYVPALSTLRNYRPAAAGKVAA